MRKTDSDLVPLPRWKQRQRALLAGWRRSKDRRLRAARSAGKAGRRGLTLAISLVGLIMVSHGVYSVYPPAGYVTGGILLWVLQWNYGSKEGSDR